MVGGEGGLVSCFHVGDVFVVRGGLIGGQIHKPKIFPKRGTLYTKYIVHTHY